MIEARKKREAEGQMALRIATNVNAALEVVTADERVILEGPVGAPAWLFRAKKKEPESTLCERERYL
jgi:hypothetical protein